ncbi:VWA domain-containing protein [Nocardia rhizosphaerae]|uniref:VWA domain-containing protein n=1 Tax=Nocardia rhizosphaerae TaxID=1691571 RepID=A0ABV8LB71_9NOCA
MRAIAWLVAAAVVGGSALVGGPGAAPAVAAPAATHNDAPVLVVLDTSGSMDESDSAGVHKLDSAKRSVLGIVRELDDSAPVGVWTYPGGGSCDSGGFVDELDMRALSPGTRTTLTADVLALRADGSTPIGPALRDAADALSDKGFRSAAMVLVSDGEATCGGDPCETAKQIRAEGFDLRVYGVAFELTGKGAEQLTCIANETGGQFFSADNGRHLIDTLSNLAANKLRLEVDAPAKAIGGGSATIRLTVHNTSLTGRANDVRVSLAFVANAHLFPAVTPPLVRIGNLPPGAHHSFDWELPVGHASGEAAYRIVAVSASGASGRHDGTITVADAGDYTAVAGDWLKKLMAEGTVGVFGDSYASGEGAGTYEPASPAANALCHRSPKTHVAQLISADQVRNYACSDAVQVNLVAPQAGRVPDMSQIEQMSRADEALDAAFLSIGGNDIGFAGIVIRCLFPNELPVTVYRSPVTGVEWQAAIDIECGHSDAAADGTPIGTSLADRGIAQRIHELGTQLPDTYRALYDAINVERYVARRGHEAPLIVLGYPMVFPNVVGVGCGEFSAREVTFANRIVTQLNEALALAVHAAAGDSRKIYFVDAVESAMQPANTLCDGDRSGIVPAALLDGAAKTFTDQAGLQELMHPNTTGYGRIAGAIATWSSGTDEPGDTSATTGRRPPTVTTGERTCMPMALTMARRQLAVEQGVCLYAHREWTEPSTYWAEVHSTPITLGAGRIEPGDGPIRLDIPPTLPPGRHTLHLVVMTESGEVTNYTADLVVAVPLPWWWWAIVVGSAVSLLGAAVLVVRVWWLRRSPEPGRGHSPDPAPDQVLPRDAPQ